MEKFKPPHIISAVFLIGLLLAILNFGSPDGGLFGKLSNTTPPLRPIEEFTLFGLNKVELNQNTQNLRGNIGSNNEIKIRENSQITGDVFSNQIRLSENTLINGNIFFKQLQLTPTTQILGISSTNITFPVAKIPSIPQFNFGLQDLKIPANTTSTISSGNFRDLEIGENSRLIFKPGTYNLRSFRAKQNSKIIFESTATINIADSLDIKENVRLFPKNNSISPQQIIFQTPTKSTINIGNNANLVFKLIAPNTNVQIGKESLIRGNVWAKNITIGEKTALRDTLWFSVPSRPEDFVSVGGVSFAINVVEVDFTDEATFEDAERIAVLLNGRIRGFGPVTNLYGIEITTRTPEALTEAIQKVEALNNPKIEGAFRAVALTHGGN